MIVTYDIIADFTTQRYDRVDIAQHRCAATLYELTYVQICYVGLYAYAFAHTLCVLHAQQL